LRLGLIECAPGKFATLKLTEAGLISLRQRTPVTLTKPTEVPTEKVRTRVGAIECDEALFERLRALRRNLADKRDVPAYVIFSDVALREMARVYPTTASEFRRIPGVGEQKLKDFAKSFLDEIAAFLGTNPRQTFSEPRASVRRRSTLNDSESETLRRFRRGESIDEIARARGFVRSTIYSHLLAAIECGKIVVQSHDRFFTPAQEKEIAAAFCQVSDGKLVDASALLDGKYDMGLLRVFRAFDARGRL
jgi:ATP-dependent DNA helicase RecQ